MKAPKLHAEIVRDSTDAPDEPHSMEVRLQVYPDGVWAIRYGDSGYDSDHHGYWGASDMGLRA